MKCFGCGRELPDEVKFCHFCGAEMEEGAVASTKESETETVEEVCEGAKTAGKTVAKKAIVARIMAGVVGVAVLAGAGIGVSKRTTNRKVNSSEKKTAEIIQNSEKSKTTGEKETIDDSWKQIYIAYIEAREQANTSSCELEYALIYFDNDNIPELVVDTGYTAGGGDLVCCYDGRFVTHHIPSGGFVYAERKGIFSVGGGRMGEYNCQFYKYENGEFFMTAEGHRSESYVQEVTTYTWNDEMVTENVYNKNVEEMLKDINESPYDDMKKKEDIIKSINEW